MGAGGTLQEIVLSGLRGRGGGGFPTGRKWRSVRDAAVSSDGAGKPYVVANGAEGEPSTFKDRAIMRANPYAVVEGVAIAAMVVGAEQAFIGVKEAFEVEVARLSQAIEELAEVGVLDEVTVQVVLGPDHYLFGEETALLQVIEGHPPLPRNIPPYLHGLFASVPAVGWTATTGVSTSFAASNPTLVNNVETLAMVPAVLTRGPEWHRSLGTEQSPGVVVATVVGDVARPAVGEVELGTPLREVIDRVGGGVAPGRSVKAVLSGVANPVVTADQLDVPCSYEGMESIGSGLGAVGFTVFDDTTSMLEVAEMVSRFLYVESCGQCPACKLGCGEITDLLTRLVEGSALADDLEELAFRLKSVTDGNRCYLPVEEQQVIASLVQSFPEEVSAALSGAPLTRRGLTLSKIVDLEDGRAVYDTNQAAKQPDWTYLSWPT
jgi:NADH:ubiquinone oxidoreductase subunit F (NADH-binding)